MTMDNDFQVITDYKRYYTCPQFGYCNFNWSAIAPTDFPPSNTSVYPSATQSNILEAHFSSSSETSNPEVIINLSKTILMRVEIIDIQGHIIFFDEKMMSAGINILSLYFHSLAHGIYICRIQAGMEVISLRFIKD